MTMPIRMNPSLFGEYGVSGVLAFRITVYRSPFGLRLQSLRDLSLLQLVADIHQLFFGKFAISHQFYVLPLDARRAGKPSLILSHLRTSARGIERMAARLPRTPESSADTRRYSGLSGTTWGCWPAFACAAKASIAAFKRLTSG